MNFLNPSFKLLSLFYLFSHSTACTNVPIPSYTNPFNSQGLTSGATLIAGSGAHQLLAEFDGVTQYINLAYLYQPLPTLSTSFTVGIWLNFASLTGSNQRIWDCGNGNASDNIIIGRYGSTNNLVITIYSGGSSWTSGTLFSE